MTHGQTVEYLPNLRQLIIYAQISASHSETSLFFDKKGKKLYSGLDKVSPNDEILISLVGSFSLSVYLSFAQLNEFPQVSRIDNVLIIQFRNVDIIGALSSCAPTALLNAKALQTCTLLSCAACDAPILTQPENFTWKDLPNEHWLELLDCWSCHDNEFAPIAERALTVGNIKSSHHNHNHECHNDDNRPSSCRENMLSPSYQTLNNSSHGHILPPIGKIYCGLSHLLVHAGDLPSTTCASCEAIFGEQFFDSHFKIYRDGVKFDQHYESLSRILMHKILDTIDNHSTFHFIIKAPSSPKVYFRVLNWHMAKFNSESSNWSPAFKIGFALATDHIDVETIQLTKAQYDQVIPQLEHDHLNSLFGSTVKMPQFGELKVSYLIDK